METMAAKTLVWSVFFGLAIIVSQTTANRIEIGSSISIGTNSSLKSLSAEFAFGFYPLANGLFLVGIWFDKIPERTLVWSANRDDPAQVRSTIDLKLNGQLVLTHSNGTELQIYNGTNTSSGTLQDDGNFVLRDSSSRVIWQSFNFPTDTILPGQVLVRGHKLFSNTNGTVDYSTGRFMLEIQNLDGNVVMSAYRFIEPGYWDTKTNYGNINTSLVFNKSTASIYVANGTSILYNMKSIVPGPVQDYYHRATINDHGNLQQFVYHKENGSSRWTVIYQAMTEPCMVSNICGVFGFCTSLGDGNFRCSCLPGYTLLDERNPSKGCYPNVVKDFCDPNVLVSDFTVETIDNTDFPNGEFADMAIITESDADSCKKAVMDDCYCSAAVFDKESRCFKKRMPLLNARKSNPSTNNKVAFLKVPKANSSLEVPKRHTDSPSKFVLILSMSICSTLAIVFAVTAIYHHPLTQRYIHMDPPPKPKTVELNLKAFSFQKLNEATNGFKNKLGRGAFGTVYSGVLRQDEKDQVQRIAVKKLEKVIEQGEKEFLAEVNVIGVTHHKNLVRLVGFCNENNHRLLVYELMENGTLSSFLFTEGKNPAGNIELKWFLELQEDCYICTKNVKRRSFTVT